VKESKMKLWIINCKQYAELVSRRMDRPLSTRSRLAVKLHAWLCPPCERVASQFSILREACRHVPSEEECRTQDRLPEHARERIKSALKGCIKNEAE
jgi:hypothetical protein